MRSARVKKEYRSQAKEYEEDDPTNEDITDETQCQNSYKQQIESAKMLMSIEDFQEKIRHLEEQIMDSPKTEKDRIKNEKGGSGR